MNKNELNKLNWIKVNKCYIESMAYDQESQTLWIDRGAGIINKYILFAPENWEGLTRANQMSFNYFKKQLAYYMSHCIYVKNDD